MYWVITAHGFFTESAYTQEQPHLNLCDRYPSPANLVLVYKIRGFNSSVIEDYGLLGCDAASLG
jgi:hypothetical protein